MKALIDHIRSWAKTLYASSDSKKKQKLFQSAIKEAAYANTPFLKYHLSQKLISGIMVMLQTISFFTTYAGAKYYLHGVAPAAPLLFALSIQLGLFYLANTYTAESKKHSKHLFQLSLFVLISIVISYTGMAIVSISPENEYKNSYKHYYNEFESVKHELLSLNITDENTNTLSQHFLDNVNSIIMLGNIEIKSSNVNIKELKNLLKQSKTTHTTRNENQTTTINTAMPNAEKIIQNIADEERKIQAIKDSLERISEILHSSSSPATKENIAEYIKQTDTSDELGTNLTELIVAYNNIYNNLENTSSLQPISDGYFDELKIKTKNAIEIESITLPTYESIYPEVVNDASFSSTSTFLNYIFSMFKSSSSADTARSKLNNLKDIVNNNYEVTCLYADKYVLSPDKISFQELLAAKEALEKYGDPNVQVFSYLTTPTYFNKVIGIVILAVLIDGLTFLLGILNSKKNLTLLNLDTNKELIDNEDQLFSIVFISLIGSKVPKALQDKQLQDFPKACQQYVLEIKNEITNFLKLFQASPWTHQWGYGLYTEYDKLKEVPTNIPIISILQQLDYLKFISENDFQLLMDKYNGIVSPSTKTPAPKDTKYICLLRYRAELYLYYNTAEITTMNLNPYDKEEQK